MKKEKDIDKLSLLKTSLAFIDDSLEKNTVDQIMADPSNIFTNRRQLELLDQVLPFSLPHVVLSEFALNEAAGIQAGRLGAFFAKTLRGEQYTVVRKGEVRSLELKFSLPKEFTDRVSQTADGLEINLTDMGEAKVPMILGAIHQVLNLGDELGAGYFIGVDDVIKKGRARHHSLSREDMLPTERDPFSDLWRLDSGYLQSRVGKEDFSRSVYPEGLLLVVDDMQSKNAGVVTLVGRTGAGKSTLAKHLGKHFLRSTISSTGHNRRYGPEDNMVILKYCGPRNAKSLLEALRKAKTIAEKRDKNRAEKARKGTIIIVEEADSIRWDPSLSDDYRELGEALQNTASDPENSRRPILGVFIIGELKEGQDELPEAERDFLHGDASVFNKHRLNRELVMLKADEAEAALISLLRNSAGKNVNKIYEAIESGLDSQLNKGSISRADYDRKIAVLEEAHESLLPFLQDYVEQMLTTSSAFARLTKLGNKSKAAEFFNPTQMDAVIKSVNQLFWDDINSFLSGSSGSTIHVGKKGELAFASKRQKEIQRSFISVVDRAIESAMEVARAKGVSTELVGKTRRSGSTGGRGRRLEQAAAAAWVDITKLYPEFGADGVALMGQRDGVFAALIDERLRDRIQANDPTLSSDEFRIAFTDNADHILRILRKMTDIRTHKSLQTQFSRFVTVLEDEGWLSEAGIGSLQQAAHKALIALLDILGNEGMTKLRKQVSTVRELYRAIEPK